MTKAPVRLLIALAVVVALAAGCASLPFASSGDTYRLTVYFDRTISLFPSSQVRVLGLPAGRVASIEVADDRIKVELDIDSDIPVPADARATIVPLSLIGERYVQLFPAWTEGTPAAVDGDVIPLERTVTPVEPDEALAALKDFMDTLDPDGTGRLIDNLSQALEGQGPTLNSALGNLSRLVSTFADKDEALVGIIEHFDDFTATLQAREATLAEVLDSFAAVADLLASEREAVEGIVAGLGSTSRDALDLVTEHADALDRDLEILGRTLRSVDANLDAVGELIDTGPALVENLTRAYDPTYYRVDLRNQYEPTIGQALQALGVPIGDTICLPLDVDCEPVSSAAVPTTAPPVRPATAPEAAEAVPGAAGAPPVATAAPAAPGRVAPIDAVLGLLTGSNAEPAPAATSSPWWRRWSRSILEVAW